jgi:superoxide dismutase, Fe-Mn family
MKNGELKEIIGKTLGVDDKKINEAYVAQPKAYEQHTDSLSKQTREDHIALYHGYIKSFNDVSANLDTALNPSSMPILNPNNSRYRSLKQNETLCRNAVYLHELYFANSADVNSQIMMESLTFIRLQREFGTFDEWQMDFIACALTAGVGWAVCGYDMFLKRYHNFFIDDHDMHVPIGVYPIIVIDMWEHAAKDYRNDRKAYVISQVMELNWSVIEERMVRAEAMAEVLR